MTLTAVIFTIFALLGLWGALVVLFARRPVYNALGLLLNFVSLAAIYIMLNAPFLGVIQIIVYSGAIVVFFLFVIMILNLRDPLADMDLSFKGLMAFILMIAMLSLLGVYLYVIKLPPWKLGPEGSPERLGELLLTDYLIPFELASLLLLVAIVIAVVIGKKGEEQ